MTSRIDRDTLYLQVAQLFAERGTCERLRVGAVAVRDNRICCSGSNGTPTGEGHCSKECDLNNTCKVSIHAEANLNSSAAKHGIPLEGTTLYTTHEPCLECLKLIHQSGISKVIFAEFYGGEMGSYLHATRIGIRVEQYEVKE